MKLDKVEVARRQLGTALHLFIANADPISVHALASAGVEIAQGLAAHAGLNTFKSIVTNANPLLTAEVFEQARKSTWNAFKHFDRQNGKPRDDSEIFTEFSDEQNELALFIGWHDLGEIIGCMPIEAATFQVWLLSRSAPASVRDFLTEAERVYFPTIRSTPKAQHKQLLRKAISKARRDPLIINSHKTERRKLLLPNNLAEYKR